MTDAERGLVERLNELSSTIRKDVEGCGPDDQEHTICQTHAGWMRDAELLREAALALSASREEVGRLTRERDDAQRVCAETYQAFGALASYAGVFQTDDVERVMDNLAKHRPIHADLLPWPKDEKPFVQLEQSESALSAAREDAERLLRLLERYRKETPLGHQPHMIAHEADAAIDAARQRGEARAEGGMSGPIKAFERRERHTIMDGKVITFSPQFRAVGGAFGDYDTACGSFEVSASRNAVIVHKADLASANDVAAFLEAVAEAGRASSNLSRIDRGNYRP